MSKMLPDLVGIRKGRDVKERKKSGLEYLLAISNYVLSDYKRKRVGPANPKKNLLYMEIYSKLKNELLKNIEFSEDDLRSLICAQMNGGYDKAESETLGFYTGCLLHLLTERNMVKGKRTQFYINGGGAKFDYLFLCAKEVDELVVDNFGGDFICNGIGSNGGSVNSLIVVNSKGDFTCSYAASHRGNAKLVAVINNLGDRSAAYIGYKGNAGSVIVMNNQGRDVAGGIGFSGNVDLVMVLNNKCNQSWSSSYDTTVIMDYRVGSVKKMVLHNQERIGTVRGVKEIIEGDQALQEYGEIIRLADSMKNEGSHQEIIKVARRIYRSIKRGS